VAIANVMPGLNGNQIWDESNGLDRGAVFFISALPMTARGTDSTLVGSDDTREA
jgi:hypothetical protein